MRLRDFVTAACNSQVPYHGPAANLSRRRSRFEVWLARTRCGSDGRVIGGYHVAFATGAAPAVVAAALGSMWLPTALHDSKTAPAQ